MTEEPEYFKIREGIATYLCRKAEDGCWIVAQLGRKSGRWIKFRNPQFWKWYQENTDPPQAAAAYYSRKPPTEPVSKEEVTAILLMGKNEGEV